MPPISSASPFAFLRLFSALALACIVALTFSSCTTCCPPERCVPPAQTKFSRISIPSANHSYPTWHTRAPGPPILLLHALNGISPSTLHFALEMESWGYRVYIPSLYGDPIEGASAFGYDDALAATKFLGDDGRWDLHSGKTAGPITGEIRQMIRWVSAREGGRKICVLGNCLTGSIPLALLDEPSVQLVALAQPALPVLQFPQILFRIPQSPEKRKSLALSENQWERSLQALQSHPEKRILGFHYRSDPIAPIVKFDVLHRRLSEVGLEGRFTAYVLCPTGQRYARKRPQWVVGEYSEQSKRMLTPHSTVINPESLADRAWFRKQLRQELDQW